MVLVIEISTVKTVVTFFRESSQGIQLSVFQFFLAVFESEDLVQFHSPNFPWNDIFSGILFVVSPEKINSNSKKKIQMAVNCAMNLHKRLPIEVRKSSYHFFLRGILSLVGVGFVEGT